jgi:hypothetical protein
MRKHSWRRHLSRLGRCILPLVAAVLFYKNVGATDDSVYGIYSGECTLNNEVMRVDLEIVKNEGTQMGGDAILTLSKNGQNRPAVRVTMIGGFRDVPQLRRRGDHSPPRTKREFSFRAVDESQEFGGRFSVQLVEEGNQLEGTVAFAPGPSRRREASSPHPPGSAPVVLIRSRVSNRQPHQSPGAGTPSAVTPGEITGVYDGSLIANKRQFFAQLRLTREGASALSGLLSFSATAGDNQPLGSFKLKGKYVPTTNTFQLSSGGESTSSDGLILATATGTFEPATGKIRAQISPNNGDLDLTRNPQKTAELQAEVTGALKRLTEGPVSLDQAKSDEERRDAIVRWFNQLKKEYPDIDLHHTVLDQIYPKVLNLFGDDAFVPVFGKPFDEMTADDRNYVKLMFRRLFTGPQTRNLLDRFVDFLERPFVLDGGSFSYADVAPQLAFRRTVRKQWHETMDRLKVLAPTTADYDELVSLEKKGTDPFRDLWPSEFRQFQEGIESTKHRLADGAATDRLNAVVAGANGLDGARALATWADQEKELLDYVSENTRQQVNARITAKIGEYVEPLLHEEAEAVAALGEGGEAVNAGNKWYRHLKSTYGFAAGHPAFQAAVERLKARRAGDLSAAQPDILAEIEKQSTERGVDNVKASYFAVPGDNETDGMTAVAQAATERKQAIQREQALARYSPHERQWLQPDGTLQIPKEPPPPDEDDLRVAIVRTLEMMGGTRRNPFTVEWSNQITKAFGAYPIIKIDKVDELACSPAPGGYRVSYRVHMTIDYPDSLKRMMNSQPSLGGSMLQALTQQINGPHGTQEGRFELTEHGWWCPTMQEHALGSSD